MNHHLLFIEKDYALIKKKDTRTYKTKLKMVHNDYRIIFLFNF